MASTTVPPVVQKKITPDMGGPAKITREMTKKEPDAYITIEVWKDKPNVVTMKGKLRGGLIPRIKRDLTRAYFNRKKELLKEYKK